MTKRLLTQIFIALLSLWSTQIWAQDYTWIGFYEDGLTSEYNEMQTAHLIMWYPPFTEYWEDRGNSEFIPQYLLKVEFLHESRDFDWGESVPRLVIGDQIAGSYQLKENGSELFYEMEILTGDHITRITLQPLEDANFIIMTEHWLRMIASLEFQKEAPIDYASIRRSRHH